jgi:hypothetical protein
MTDEVAVDASVSKTHRSETVADRLAYLTRDSGTEHLLDRDGDRYALTEDGKAVLC